ncbi:MAG: hypothetical protein MJH10_18995, partial [Epibacterium sp.]|nr:hypothetical protein [Epibacterium sp.]
MNDFKGHHFWGEVVLWALLWYCRYGISYRDLETMMAERGVRVDHPTIYRWVQRYAPVTCPQDFGPFKMRVCSRNVQSNEENE